MGCVIVKQHRFQHVGSFSGVLRGFHSIETTKNGVFSWDLMMFEWYIYWLYYITGAC